MNICKTRHKFIWLFLCHDRPYLTAGKREMLADYALPASVIIMAFFGGFVFKDVECKM